MRSLDDSDRPLSSFYSPSPFVDSLCGNFVPDGVDRVIVCALRKNVTLREFPNLIVERADNFQSSSVIYHSLPSFVR